MNRGLGTLSLKGVRSRSEGRIAALLISETGMETAKGMKGGETLSGRPLEER